MKIKKEVHEQQRPKITTAIKAIRRDFWTIMYLFVHKSHSRAIFDADRYRGGSRPNENTDRHILS